MQVMTLPPNWEGYPDHRHDATAQDPNQEEVYVPLEGSGLLYAGDDVLVLPRVARFEVRVNAGGFWLDGGQAQAMQPAVRPFTRAGAIEILVDDREGARYVKVLAL